MKYVFPLDVCHFNNWIETPVNKAIFHFNPTKEICNFLLEDMKKDRNLYEFILLDTNSAKTRP